MERDHQQGMEATVVAGLKPYVCTQYRRDSYLEALMDGRTERLDGTLLVKRLRKGGRIATGRRGRGRPKPLLLISCYVCVCTYVRAASAAGVSLRNTLRPRMLSSSAVRCLLAAVSHGTMPWHEHGRPAGGEMGRMSRPSVQPASQPASQRIPHRACGAGGQWRRRRWRRHGSRDCNRTNCWC